MNKNDVIIVVFSVIVSSLISASFQVAIHTINVITYLYIVVYVYGFLPMLVLLLINALLNKKINFIKALAATFDAALLSFGLIAIFSYFSIDHSAYSSSILLIASNIFKYFPLYIINENNFNTVMIILYIIESAIYLVMLWLLRNPE